MVKLGDRGIIAQAITVIILILGLIVGYYLVTHKTQLFSRASNGPIVVKDINGNALPESSPGVYVFTVNPSSTPTVQLELTSPLGPPRPNSGSSMNIVDDVYAQSPSTPVGSKPLVCGDYGDVDGDGVISNNDAQMILQAVVNNSNDETMTKIGDVNGDGKLSDADALEILKYLSGAETTFPVCQKIPPSVAPSATTAQLSTQSTTSQAPTGTTNADVNKDGVVDKKDVDCITSQFGQTCAQNVPQATPSQLAASTGGQVYTVSYKIGESPASLSSELPYNKEPISIPFTFSNPAQMGQRFIFVEFKDSTGHTQQYNVQVILTPLVVAGGNTSIPPAPSASAAASNPSGGTQACTFVSKWDYASAGQSLNSINRFFVLLDNQGDIYLEDPINERVSEFNSNGQFITKFGDNSNGQLSGSTFGEGNPTGHPFVGVDTHGNVYIVDGTSSVKKFNSNGSFITKWGSYGSSNGQFAFIGGIAVDSQDNVYVTDASYKSIQKFDSNGQFISKMVIQGNADPRGIALDKLGNIYAISPSWRTIERFSANGSPLNGLDLQTYDSLGLTGSGVITIDSKGNIYILGKNNIQKIGFDGINFKFIATIGTEGTADGQFENLTSMSMDNNDNLYVVDSGNHRIQKFNCAP